MAASRRKRAETRDGFDRASCRIQLQPYELTGIAVRVRKSTFVERAYRQFTEAAVGIDPLAYFGLMEMSAKDEVYVPGEQAPR